MGYYHATSQFAIPCVIMSGTHRYYHATSQFASEFACLVGPARVGEPKCLKFGVEYLRIISVLALKGFFDKETYTGEVVGRMSGDTVLIQDAMGEEVGKFIQLSAAFIGGLVVSFLKGWLLTLVMLSSIPPLVISDALMSILIPKLASRGQTAYSLAATIVEQTIGSMRTVASFTGEKQAIAKYNKSLTKAYKSGVQEGLTSGFGFGFGALMHIMYSNYALGVWFGGKLIIDKGYMGGDVINVLFSVLTGSLSLGQASPCLGTFAAGQAAAFKMFEAIKRKPQIDAYDTNGQKLDDMYGEIELKDVYFNYPGIQHDQMSKYSTSQY